MVPSLDAHRYLKASMQLCSWDANWRSVLLRGFVDKPSAAEFTTAATPDYFLSLVTTGTCRIESWRDGRWNTADYCPGSIGFRPPGVSSTLRWISDEPHSTLHLYLPAEIFEEAVASLRDGSAGGISLPPQLALKDPLVANIITAMKNALLSGAPDLYAETAAQFLAVHLLQRHFGVESACSFRAEDQRLQRADAYLRSRLGEPVSLAAIAQAAGLSRFHLLRLFKDAYGETPLKRLTRFRIAQAKRLLRRSGASVTEIALQCGYASSAHFATAFRQQVGVSPSVFRSA